MFFINYDLQKDEVTLTEDPVCQDDTTNMLEFLVAVEEKRFSSSYPLSSRDLNDIENGEYDDTIRASVLLDVQTVLYSCACLFDG